MLPFFDYGGKNTRALQVSMPTAWTVGQDQSRAQIIPEKEKGEVGGFHHEGAKGTKFLCVHTVRAASTTVRDGKEKDSVLSVAFFLVPDCDPVPSALLAFVHQAVGALDQSLKRVRGPRQRGADGHGDTQFRAVFGNFCLGNHRSDFL